MAVQLLPVLVAISSTLYFDKTIYIALLTAVALSTILILPPNKLLKVFIDKYPEHFNTAFYVLTAVRLLMAASLMIYLLGWTKISEIHFTVSFIISYLYQSVTETIFTERYLVSSTNRKK